jgi:hypothetical protein
MFWHRKPCKLIRGITPADHSTNIQPIQQWFYSPLLGPSRFFSFIILYTVGMTPWARDQPGARPQPTHTDILASSGIRPHDHSDRHINTTGIKCLNFSFAFLNDAFSKLDYMASNGGQMNNESARIRKEVVVADPSIRLQGLRTTKKPRRILFSGM